MRVLPERAATSPSSRNLLFFLPSSPTSASDLPARRCCAACSQRRPMGFEVYAAFEYEFFMFDETALVREKGYGT